MVFLLGAIAPGSGRVGCIVPIRVCGEGTRWHEQHRCGIWRTKNIDAGWRLAAWRLSCRLLSFFTTVGLSSFPITFSLRVGVCLSRQHLPSRFSVFPVPSVPARSPGADPGLSWQGGTRLALSVLRIADSPGFLQVFFLQFAMHSQPHGSVYGKNGTCVILTRFGFRTAAQF
jgi:hypothetical protein